MNDVGIELSGLPEVWMMFQDEDVYPLLHIDHECGKEVADDRNHTALAEEVEDTHGNDIHILDLDLDGGNIVEDPNRVAGYSLDNVYMMMLDVVGMGMEDKEP